MIRIAVVILFCLVTHRVMAQTPQKIILTLPTLVIEKPLKIEFLLSTTDTVISREQYVHTVAYTCRYNIKRLNNKLFVTCVFATGTDTTSRKFEVVLDTLQGGIIPQRKKVVTYFWSLCCIR